MLRDEVSPNLTLHAVAVTNLRSLSWCLYMIKLGPCGLLTVAGVLWGSSARRPAAVTCGGNSAAGGEEGGARCTESTAGGRSNCTNSTSWRRYGVQKMMWQVNHHPAIPIYR